MNNYSIISYSGEKLPSAYRALLFSKWLLSLRYSNDFFKLIDGREYFTNYQKFIELILAKPETTVRLAVLTDDQDVVLGFAVNRKKTLDYIYVNKENRKAGIGKALYPQNTNTITHITKIGLSIWGSKLPAVRFNPFA
jgi:hypothetical protein